MTNSRRILIVDDDNDFVSLLTEILSQAGYQVVSSTQAAQGLELAKAQGNEAFELLVLDQRMGGMSGSEFLERLRQSNAKLPVIVVSGFLDNASAQLFINLGVSGIFFKPLNIFALLKRVEEIFKGSVKPSGAAAGEAGLRGLTQMPFASQINKDVFLKKVQGLSGFKGNLLIVGDTGSPFEVIADEIVKKSAGHDKLLAWDKSFADPAKFAAAMSSAAAVTVFVKKMSALTPPERATIVKAAKHEAPFEKITNLRFIFGLEEDLDTLYEKKLVDDEFYLFLGNLELKIPRAASAGMSKAEGLQRTVKKIGETMAPFKAAGSAGQVLVLDDEDLHAQMVVDLLETAGYRSVKVNNPSEALVLLKKERFSLIITDFRMPGINGVDFVTQTRQLDPTTPIFIVTGNIEVPEMVRIGNMGITRLIKKPIDPAKFLEEVASVAKP